MSPAADHHHVVLLLLLLFASTYFAVIASATYQSNEYVYSFNRDMLIDAERHFEKRTDPASVVSDPIF
jgi:hypothetical protein